MIKCFIKTPAKREMNSYGHAAIYSGHQPRGDAAQGPGVLEPPTHCLNSRVREITILISHTDPALRCSLIPSWAGGTLVTPPAKAQRSEVTRSRSHLLLGVVAEKTIQDSGTTKFPSSSSP